MLGLVAVGVRSIHGREEPMNAQRTGVEPAVQCLLVLLLITGGDVSELVLSLPNDVSEGVLLVVDFARVLSAHAAHVAVQMGPAIRFDDLGVLLHGALAVAQLPLRDPHDVAIRGMLYARLPRDPAVGDLDELALLLQQPPRALVVIRGGRARFPDLAEGFRGPFAPVKLVSVHAVDPPHPPSEPLVVDDRVEVAREARQRIEGLEQLAPLGVVPGNGAVLHVPNLDAVIVLRHVLPLLLARAPEAPRGGTARRFRRFPATAASPGTQSPSRPRRAVLPADGERKVRVQGGTTSERVGSAAADDDAARLTFISPEDPRVRISPSARIRILGLQEHLPRFHGLEVERLEDVDLHHPKRAEHQERVHTRTDAHHDAQDGVFPAPDVSPGRAALPEVDLHVAHEMVEDAPRDAEGVSDGEAPAEVGAHADALREEEKPPVHAEHLRQPRPVDLVQRVIGRKILGNAAEGVGGVRHCVQYTHRGLQRDAEDAKAETKGQPSRLHGHRAVPTEAFHGLRHDADHSVCHASKNVLQRPKRQQLVLVVDLVASLEEGVVEGQRRHRLPHSPGHLVRRGEGSAGDNALARLVEEVDHARLYVLRHSQRIPNEVERHEDLVELRQSGVTVQLLELLDDLARRLELVRDLHRRQRQRRIRDARRDVKDEAHQDADHPVPVRALRILVLGLRVCSGRRVKVRRVDEADIRLNGKDDEPFDEHFLRLLQRVQQLQVRLGLALDGLALGLEHVRICRLRGLQTGVPLGLALGHEPKHKLPGAEQRALLHSNLESANLDAHVLHVHQVEGAIGIAILRRRRLIDRGPCEIPVPAAPHGEMQRRLGKARGAGGQDDLVQALSRLAVDLQPAHAGGHGLQCRG
eukprot:scaffold757_cov246-Pinguiococcus_pyrenoidosus.AAC.5